MAIRFSCGACGQPIEINDEWASKQAVCPYCHKTIAVPALSTLPDLSAIPTATPLPVGLPGAGAAAYGANQQQEQHSRPESRNYLAIVAALLTAIATLCVILTGSIMRAHADELEVVTRDADGYVQGGHSVMESAQRAWSDYYEESGGPPDWLLGISLLMIAGLMSWLAGLICSIIACRRRRRRGLAVASLVLSFLLPFIFCGVTGSAMKASAAADSIIDL